MKLVSHKFLFLNLYKPYVVLVLIRVNILVLFKQRSQQTMPYTNLQRSNDDVRLRSFDAVCFKFPTVVFCTIQQMAKYAHLDAQRCDRH